MHLLSCDQLFHAVLFCIIFSMSFSDAKSVSLIGKDPNAGKDQRQEEKGATEDEMVGWHHQLNGHEIEQTPENS